MELKSRGYKADLAFPGAFGEIADRGEYLAVRTPKTPGYFWGNFLLFAAPPGPGDCDRWRACFAEEFADCPGVGHEAFGWDAPDGELGDVAPFKAAGFAVDAGVVMTAADVALPDLANPQVVTRPIAGAAEWDAVFRAESDYVDRPPPNPRIEARIEAYKKMAGNGDGWWYGAFMGGELVGGMGIYKAGDTGVVDSVSTHPDFRRRGIGRTAVYRAARHALASLGIEELLLVAEEAGAAKRMYEQLGFKVAEKQLGMLRA